MKLFIFIPRDRTTAGEGMQVPAVSFGQAVDLLFPNGGADINHKFFKNEWHCYSIKLEEV